MKRRPIKTSDRRRRRTRSRTDEKQSLASQKSVLKEEDEKSIIFQERSPAECVCKHNYFVKTINHSRYLFFHFFFSGK